MAAKLSSISRIIPWSLLLRAGIFGAAWLLLPFWLFFLIALILYFLPVFQPLRLILPFALTVFFAGILSPNFWAAALLAALFFLILGIKNLTLVNRMAAYETVLFLLLFLAYLNLFFHFPNSGRAAVLLLSGFAAAAYALLLRNAARYATFPKEWSPRHQAVIFGLAGLLVWQWTWAVLFLPLNPFYQTALLFLFAAVLTEMFLDHLAAELGRRRILGYFSAFVVFASAILAANPWQL